jgi:flagellar motor switch protein FliM
MSAFRKARDGGETDEAEAWREGPPAAREPLLSREEIESLIGDVAVPPADEDELRKDGDRRGEGARRVFRQRPPAPEMILESLAPLLKASLRGLAIDNVEVAADGRRVRSRVVLDSLRRSGTVLAFRIVQFDALAFASVDAALIDGLTRAMFGAGARLGTQTMIERAFARRILRIVRGDIERAFGPWSAVDFELDAAELEDAAAEEWNAADAARLRVEVDGCAGAIELMLPRAAGQRGAESGGSRAARA